MNKLFTKERRNIVLGLTSCIGLAALASTAVAHSYSTDTERAFRDQSTSDGKCLDQTPFDLDQEATLLIRDVNGQSVLSVLPEETNTYGPSVLNFTFDKGVLSVNYVVADYETGSYAARNCGLTEGY